MPSTLRLALPTALTSPPSVSPSNGRLALHHYTFSPEPLNDMSPTRAPGRKRPTSGSTVGCLLPSCVAYQFLRRQLPHGG